MAKNPTDPNKVVWDGKSGSLVDAEALGSAIEVFLRRSEVPDSADSSASSGKGAAPKAPLNKCTGAKPKAGWFSNKSDDDSTEACDSSLCSTLKDLFVK